ncbi:MAG: hypothetical protein U9Q30_00430 [Campylobacterota bacterium]|nr:hypothetical protein [Campylobacterota bacterium]
MQKLLGYKLLLFISIIFFINLEASTKPYWINGYSSKYKFYGVGSANNTLKGKHYQENIARSVAKKELQKKYDKYKLSNDTMFRYNKQLKTKKYLDKRSRIIYIIIYLDK